jgi:hypothetical protein
VTITPVTLSAAYTMSKTLYKKLKLLNLTDTSPTPFKGQWHCNMSLYVQTSQSSIIFVENICNCLRKSSKEPSVTSEGNKYNYHRPYSFVNRFRQTKRIFAALKLLSRVQMHIFSYNVFGSSGNRTCT